MTALVISIVSLAIGPLLFRLLRQRKEVYGFLDGFVLVGVAGLVLVEILPQAVDSLPSGAWQIFGLAAAGFVLPFFLERRLALLPLSPNAFFQGLMVVGLFFHQMLDGMALTDLQAARSIDLQLAVILHQLPKGLFLWNLLRSPSRGNRLPALLIAGLAAMTAVGYFLGDHLAELVHNRGAVLFQAFVAGGLLHVIVHHVPGERSSLSQRGTAFWAGLGALLSMGGLVALRLLHDEGGTAAAEHTATGFTSHFLDLYVESAPSILLGFAAAGLLHAFTPRAIWGWFHARGRLAQTLRGIAIGLPLPICSCGVAPVFLGLVKRGVPTAAAVAFLIATPEIGLDSVFLSWRLLGWKITLARVLMAFTVALAVGLTISRLMDRGRDGETIRSLDVRGDLPASPRTGRTREALRFGLGELVDEIGVWLLVGLAVAALLAPLSLDWLRSFAESKLDVFALSALGLPVYVCASGTTPLAAVLVAKGVSAGAILVFLINGPATNVTTFGIIRKTHGLPSSVLFALCMFAITSILGLALNLLLPGLQASAPTIGEHAHGTLDHVAAVLLALVIAAAVLRRGPRGFLGPLFESFSPSVPGSSGESGDRGHSHSHSHAHD